ncbi:ankyrin repeat domain-containing protein [Candidatus Parcubacteria bacterium]|nr:MAG: ankyrin repeat domain-containing protein [Candidatus Parcubacteria bacterium]
MKKKISWIELIIIFCVVIIFVSGWKFWRKPNENLKITPVPSAVSIDDTMPVPKDKEKDLCNAIIAGNFERIKELVRENPEIVNSRCYSYSSNPHFHEVVRKDYKEIVKLFIENGADVNAKNPSGWTPLHFAKDIDIAILLIEKGADVNAKTLGNVSPLHESAFRCNKEISQLLIEKGADVNAKDESGSTPLHGIVGVLTFENKKETILTLLKNGANINVQNNSGLSPLHIAAKYGTGYEELLPLLIENGADINAKTNDGKTPLDLAAESNSYYKEKTITLLLEYGAKDGNKL